MSRPGVLQAGIDTPLGPLRLRATARGICGVAWTPDEDDEDLPGALPADEAAAREILSRAAVEFAAYFAGERRTFSVPADLEAHAPSPFTRRVLAAAGAVAYGETTTYGRLARRLGVPGAARAVGRALAANPVPLLIPCHRVIRADGAPGGYAGDAPGHGRKAWLLALEAQASAPTGSNAASASSRRQSSPASLIPSSSPRTNSRMW